MNNKLNMFKWIKDKKVFILYAYQKKINELKIITIKIKCGNNGVVLVQDFKTTNQSCSMQRMKGQFIHMFRFVYLGQVHQLQQKAFSAYISLAKTPTDWMHISKMEHLPFWHTRNLLYANVLLCMVLPLLPQVSAAIV